MKQIYEQQKLFYDKYDYLEFIPIADKLDYHPYILTIETQKKLYPLAKIESFMQRFYLYPEITSHIIGYVTGVTPEDLKIKKYNLSDEIGRIGVEQGFDELLKGSDGIIKRVYKQYPHEYQDLVIKPKVNGRDLYLSIDINAQKKLYELIKESTKKDVLKDALSYGAIVQNVQTGEIIALASYPSFDSNKFIKGLSQDEYNSYLKDPGKPLMNKVISYPQPPGSTFKTLTEIAAMYYGDANKNTKYYTGGVFNYGGVNFIDFNKQNFGEIDMVKALCVSSNIYHMKLILDLDKKVNGEAAGKCPRLNYKSFCKRLTLMNN
ncbi:MAG: penicillin-binding transpeptidase domain-containing protein [Candidatus Methanomethylicia archaeon]